LPQRLQRQLQLLPVAGTRSGESLRGSLGGMDCDQETFHEQNEKEAKNILRLHGAKKDRHCNLANRRQWQSFSLGIRM
jgi:hypothetical protein